MKVALCTIGRLENQYAVEYVEWYKKIGFDKIFIYDDNHDGEEHFEDVLQTYVDDGFVDIIDFRNKEVAQLPAYNDCYQRYGNEYDWIAFFDFDEFLTLVEDDNIHSFLSHFNEFECVKINWMVYTDNDLVINDHRPILERFTSPMDFNKHIAYGFPENNHVKSIVRGGIKNFKWGGTPHTPNMDLKYCDSTGIKSDKSPFSKYNFSKAYIKHFITKTIDEWLNKKQIRGASDRTKKQSSLTYTIDKFFKYNDKTKEKTDYIDLKCGNASIFICAHKDFKNKVTNKAYKIVDIRECRTKEHNGLNDKFYSEILHYFNVATDFNYLPKYVGFCHYRRYFNFLDNIPDMDELFKSVECVVVEPLKFKKTNKEQYASYHNIEDLYIIGGILAHKYPEYAKCYEYVMNSKLFFPYNMFIMKREDFLKYIDFIKSVLDDYIEVVGTDIEKRIENNKDKYLKNIYPNNTVEYQYRIGGYLAERLTNVFIIKNFKKLKAYPVIVTENKYKNRKINEENIL